VAMDSRCIVGLCLLGAVLSGCGDSTAAMDLITAAREGLTMEQRAVAAQHEQALRDLQAQQAAMDAAFDADVQLAAAGKILDADQQPIALTPEWVIEARQGYIAARDALTAQQRSAEAAYAAQLDNLRASDESLEMASQLILQQSRLAGRVQQVLLNTQRRLADGR